MTTYTDTWASDRHLNKKYYKINHNHNGTRRRLGQVKKVSVKRQQPLPSKSTKQPETRNVACRFMWHCTLWAVIMIMWCLSVGSFGLRSNDYIGSCSKKTTSSFRGISVSVIHFFPGSGSFPCSSWFWWSARNKSCRTELRLYMPNSLKAVANFASKSKYWRYMLTTN